MAAQNGRDLLLKIGDGADSESFVTVAGLRTTSLSFNAGSIDATDAAATDMWRILLDAAGLKSAEISGCGVFRDSAGDALIRTAFFAQSLAHWQIVIPDFGTLAGAFKITELRYDGPYDSELMLSLSLSSAGTLTFTAS